MMMKRFFSVLLLVAALAAPAAAQRTLATRPHMPVADAKQATLHFQGLSSTSAFLLADLVSGDLDEDALVEKYGLVRSNGRLAVSAIATLQGGTEALKSYGVSQTAVYGESSSLLIPLEAFVAFAQSGLCSWLDVGAKARPALSNARSVMGIDAIHNGQYLPHGYDGTGVVVGIIDIGFEYGHPAFYSADGATYRVKRVWDQNATSGTAPAGYSYGRELTTQSTILAARYSQTDETHGTHVAGIAAGCGGSTTQTAAYRGMAPGADIVLVATTMNNSGVLDGINYIRSYAASQQKPCVINMSIGSHVGPHDGTSAFDRACDEYLTSRPDSLILVGAAGNEGLDNLHVSKLFPGTDSLLYTFLDFVDPASGQCVIDIWGAPNVPFQAGLAVVNTTTGEFADAGNFYGSSSSYYESESQFNNMLQMQVYASGTYAWEGTMKVAYSGQRPQWQQPKVDVIVRRAGSGDRVAAQEMGETGQYLAGRYDVEVQTLPVTTLRGVEVRGGAATELSVPMPGMLVLSKPKGITTGAIFRLRDGQVGFATDLNPSTAGERLLLQPGQYELVLHPQNATKYDKVQTKRFVIESSQTTKIQF